MAVKRVIKGVHIVPMGFANAFLIERDQGGASRFGVGPSPQSLVPSDIGQIFPYTRAHSSLRQTLPHVITHKTKAECLLARRLLSKSSMGRPRATTIPLAINQLRQKRLPFFRLWFERWKRDLKKVTVVREPSGRSIQEETPRRCA